MLINTAIAKFDALQTQTTHSKLANSEANISILTSELKKIRDIVTVNIKPAVSTNANTACSLPAATVSLPSRAAFSSVSAASTAKDVAFVSQSATASGTESAKPGSVSAAAITANAMCASGSRGSRSVRSPKEVWRSRHSLLL